jgi:recombination protein RecT
MNPRHQLISKPADLLKYLEKSKSAISMALPKHLNPERMMRLALTCFSTTPALRECTPQSILSSVVVAAQIGLEPGIAGQGYLIPYKSTCTFVPGWQGLVGLLNNTGRATAWTGAVFEGDQFDFQLGSSPVCNHIPGENYGDPDKLQWVYAIGKVNGAEQPVIEAWPMSRVWKHRDKFNKVGRRHYSYDNPEMYARKVVLLQVLKYMPRSIELNNAIAATDAAEMGRAVTVEHGVIIDVEHETAPERQAPVDPFADNTPAIETPNEEGLI